MAELIGHLVALMDVDGATVKVGLDVPGNEAYLDAVRQGGRTVRGPSDEELARALEYWRRQEGRVDGFKRQRVAEFRSHIEPGGGR